MVGKMTRRQPERSAEEQRAFAECSGRKELPRLLKPEQIEAIMKKTKN